MSEPATVPQIEETILASWRKRHTFAKTLAKTKSKKPYIFYDGPPFATGMPHYGHLLGSFTKDVFGRYHTMQGRYVGRVWGWDCHGLPIENIAEKELKINSKDEIEKMGVKKFNDFCRNKVLGYADAWKDVIERIGRWVDMDHAYKTMDNEYIESVWWAFKQIWEKGYLYEGERILMYCPRCATPLAKAEIAMDNSYKMIKEESVVVEFKLRDLENTYALAWTTTPWTLPSNLALTVNPELEYVYVKDVSSNKTYLLAQSVVGQFFKDANHEIVGTIKGKKLAGTRYEPLFPYFAKTPNAFQIIVGDFVTEQDGTGIVHTAPAFGEADYDICKKNNIPLVQPVDERGRFTQEVTDFSGKFVHDTNIEIISFLKKQGKVALVKKIEHEYPFCYRCETKLLYRAIPAWFVDIQKIKPKLLALSKKINWHPEFLTDGRVKYTIETAPDWNISRNRYWATAIPIWVSKDGEKLVIGSIQELKKYATNLKGTIDLHKDYLDDIILKKNGKEFRRIPEVLDCWFESGAMTFAQFHYPFENKAFFEKNFPAQFVAEYIAQVRAWFYYMLVLSAILFDDLPFEHVVTTGTILAEDGQKMSKSKNNFKDPILLINKYGSDALRFYLLSSPVMNAENLNFSEKGVDEVNKKVILLLYNTLKFYETVRGKEKGNARSTHVMDQWILMRLSEVHKTVYESLEAYDLNRACATIKTFVEDLSTWYVRVNRDRLSEDVHARETLQYVLSEFSKIAAPLLPFATEYIFQTIHGAETSVHLENYPKLKALKGSTSLMQQMETVREIVSLGLRARDQAQIGLKWPLASAQVQIPASKLSKELGAIVREQLNVKVLSTEKSDGVVTVQLDTRLTPELEAEGFAREISRAVQAYRKELGLEKKTKVHLGLSLDAELTEKIAPFASFIQERTNAKKVTFSTEKELTETFKNRTTLQVREKRGLIGIFY